MSRRGLIVFWSLFGAYVCWWLVARYRSSADPSQALHQRLHSPARVTSQGHTRFDLPPDARRTTLDRQLDELQPNVGEWNSEVVSAAITGQLKHLSSVLANSLAKNEDLKEFTAASYDGVTIVEEELETVFENTVLRVLRLPNDAKSYRPTSSLREQLASLLRSNATDQLRCAFKVTQIEPQGEFAQARVLLECVRQSNQAVEQVDAVLTGQWQMDGDEPKLRELRVLEYEKVVLTASGRHLFEDVTVDVLSSKADEQQRSDVAEQVSRDIGHWSERLSAIDDMSIYGHHGIAVGDVNGDGLDDLYVCDSGGLPNRLYVQQPDGTVRDLSRQSHADWLESTSSALLVDLDNDGDSDLIVATVAGVIVAANDGTGVFSIRAALADMPEAQSLSAADYDNDGDLDFYVTIYGPGGAAGKQRGSEATPPIPYQDANNGGRNRLFENQGNFQFADVTAQRGLDMNNQRFSFAASWEDFDLDGDMDLYVANDFGRNNLYVNEKGTFRDLAAERGVEDMAGGMSVSWGDANQDGQMDLYIGNMFSAAGNRVTYQRRFVSSRPAESTAGIQRMARGNTLFIGEKSGTFADVSEESNVTMGRWAWSSKFADLNNDGREDLVVANGYFTNRRPDDL